MEVVDKIENTLYNKKEVSLFLTKYSASFWNVDSNAEKISIISNGCGTLAGTEKIFAIYNVCVLFIKEYNKQTVTIKEINTIKTIQELGMTNEVNLCNSCTKDYPGCNYKNVIFGTGIGNDNIAACSTYIPDVPMIL